MNPNTIITIGWENESVQISAKKALVYTGFLTLVSMAAFLISGFYMVPWEKMDIVLSIVFAAILFAYSRTIK